MKLTPDMKASKMSSGMMAKLKLAVNLSRNASVIMLDEPLNGVDIVAREQVINAVISKASPKYHSSDQFLVKPYDHVGSIIFNGNQVTVFGTMCRYLRRIIFPGIKK